MNRGACSRRLRPSGRWWVCFALSAALVGAALAQDAAATLRDRHASLREALRTSPLQRPVVIESQQSSGNLMGRVYAAVDQPFSRLATVLPAVNQWCDILMLHLNNKQCQQSVVDGRPVLSVWVSRRYDIPLESAQRIDFVYQAQAQTANYLSVTLSADKGPLGSHDYRIRVEAMPLGDGQSFVHMSYAYEFGMAGRMAMQAYLATAGRAKIGFTVVERKSDGQPVYVGSLRGLVERNTMRYFLALEAYLGSMAQPPAQQQEFRLRQWIAAVERFAPQLHEAGEDEYLEMKRRELRR
jgi:hypothetical protein